MTQLTEPLHHAYGIAGDATELIPEILSALRRGIKFEPRGNPDFREERHEVMGIGEVRTLRDAAERIAVTGGKKVFVVSVRGATREAQNALLKIFEEPPPETHFFFVVPSFEILLPTLRSRLCEIQYLTEGRLKDFSRAERFLKGKVPARLRIVQEFLKQREETQENGGILTFLDELEYALAARERERNANALAEILVAKKYSRDRAPSFKLLLEHLALVLPEVE